LPVERPNRLSSASALTMATASSVTRAASNFMTAASWSEVRPRGAVQARPVAIEFGMDGWIQTNERRKLLPCAELEGFPVVGP
jgi:hypothetical protein